MGRTGGYRRPEGTGAAARGRTGAWGRRRVRAHRRVGRTTRAHGWGRGRGRPVARGYRRAPACRVPRAPACRVPMGRISEGARAPMERISEGTACAPCTRSRAGSTRAHAAEIRVTAGAPWTWRTTRSRAACPSKSRRTSVRYVSKSGPPRDADFRDTPEVAWPSSPSPCASTFRPRTLLFAPERLGYAASTGRAGRPRTATDDQYRRYRSPYSSPTDSPQVPEASCVGRVGHVSVDSCPTYRNTSPFWVQLPTFDPPFYVYSHGSLWFYVCMYVCM